MSVMFLGPTKQTDLPSMWRDVQTGDAGWAARLGVSLVAAAGLAALAMVVLAVADALLPPITRQYTRSDGIVRTSYYSPIRDEHVAIALAFAGAAWCFMLTRIWATYRRYRTVIRTTFGVIAVWVVAVPICVLIDKFVGRSEEFWIAACILAACAASILLVTSASYKAKSGRAIANSAGEVNLNCPNCGYSMIGLNEARCPECGTQFTLDDLIRRQDYDALRKSPSLRKTTPQAVTGR